MGQEGVVKQPLIQQFAYYNISFTVPSMSIEYMAYLELIHIIN